MLRPQGTRRTILIVVRVWLALQPGAQLTLLSLTNLVALLTHLGFQPFGSRFHNASESASLVALLALTAALMAVQASGQVTWERLINAKSDPANWLTYGGTYQSQRYTTLDQITPATVGRLRPVWLMSTGMNNGHQAPPFVSNGVMFAGWP